MRQKEVSAVVSRMTELLGGSPFQPGEQVDLAEGPEYDVIFVGGQVLAIVAEGEPFPTVRGLLSMTAGRRYVTVDMGAVPHVSNGADVMAPGIVDADPSISRGDLVWVRDERNLKPLAIGKALMEGSQMVELRKGKAVKTIHHVGDALWKAAGG